MGWGARRNRRRCGIAGGRRGAASPAKAAPQSGGCRLPGPARARPRRRCLMAGPESFDLSTIGLEVQHSIHTELQTR